MRYFQRMVGVPGLYNLGLIRTGIYRSGQPSHEVGYKSAKDIINIKTIVNLRNTDEFHSVVDLAMQYVHYPLSVLIPVNVQQFRDILRVIEDPDNHPVLIHCAQGHDRTGIISAAVRLDDEWTLDDAIEEMQSYGYNDLWVPMMMSLREYAKSKKGAK